VARTGTAAVQTLLRLQASRSHLHRRPVGLAPLDPSVAGLARRQGSHQAGTKVLWVIPHRGEDWGRGVDVGLLKPFKGEPPTKTSVLPPIHHGRACAELEAVLRGRMARGCRELLMQWKGLPMADVTWTDWEELRCLYPTFQLEDQWRKNRASANQGNLPAASGATD
jgi:hypothetical protein